MTRDEVSRLLKVTPPERRLLYETTFVSGLRANELRNLTLTHLDLQRGGLHLEASWTKNRKSGFQPLPCLLLHRLRDFAESGEPARLYEKAFQRGGSKRQPPHSALLYVPSHTARCLYRDLAAAGVPKTTPKGKLDFHAARVAFINFLIENGDVTPKELQELARHSSIDMSWNVYGRANEERARDAVENLSAIMEIEAESVPFVHRLAVGAERESATPVDTGGCALTKLAPALGLESEHRILQFRAELTQEAAKSLHFNALDLVTDGGEIQNCALCGQTHGTSEHDSCVPCAYIDAELAQVILMWTLLSTNEKAQILALAREQTGAA